MSVETIDTVTFWLTLISLLLAAVGSIGIIAVAIYQSLKSRTVRWDALIFVGVLLWSFPFGIRNYGPELVDATIDLLNNLAGKREPMEEAIKAFIGDAGEIVPTIPVVVDTSQPTIIITSTPFPNYAATATILAPTPTPPMSLQDFEATATKMAQGNPTPRPTIFVCKSPQDVTAGCQPPTPQPGN